MNCLDSLTLTKILFFVVFICTFVYMVSSFADPKNILFKVPKWHRIPYRIGLIIITGSSYKIFSSDAFAYSDLNTFLIGAAIILTMAAIWDKRVSTYNNPPNHEKSK